jgi:hypothetical protein
MKREVKLLTDVYKEDKEGNLTLVKGDVVSKNFMDLDDITGPFEVLTQKGVPYKTRCQVIHKDLGAIIIKHRYNEVLSWVNPVVNKIGFKR